MQQQSEDFYTLEVQKLMSSDVLFTHWSHNMDLLIIVTVDNLLQLYRINFKAQKVFQIQQDKPITAVAFSPDSQYIAYALNSGQTYVIKTQNGQKLLTISDPLSQQIRSFNFIQYSHSDISQILPFKTHSLIQKLLLPISPHKNCNKQIFMIYIVQFNRQSIIKLNYFNQLNPSTPFNLLLSTSQHHTIINLNGFMTIAQINYSNIIRKQFNNQIDNYTIQYSTLNNFNHKINTIIVGNNFKNNKYQINLIQFQSSILYDMQTDIIKLNCLLNYVTEIINFIEQAYPAVEVHLRDILRQYNSKINLIDDPDTENVNPCTQLFKFLNCGITSTALINFLTKQIYDTKVLQKLDQTLNTTFNNLHDLILQSIQNSLQRCYLLLLQIKTLSGLEKYTSFSIPKNLIISSLQKIQKLYTMGQILLIQSTQVKFDIRNLLVWLNKASIKTTTDPNVQIENTKSYLNRYTVDFNRLHNFIENQDKFKLQNLMQFFNKTQQINKMNIPECEFRLLGEINKNDHKKSINYKQKTVQIQKLLQLQSISLLQHNPQSNNLSNSFNSPNSFNSCQNLSYLPFKQQIKLLKDEWKVIKQSPIKSISEQLSSRYKITRIKQINMCQMYDLQLKTYNKKSQLSQTNKNSIALSQLILYFLQKSNPLQQPSQPDYLYSYNTHTHTLTSLTIPTPYSTLSLSIGSDLILLVQNPLSMQQQQKSIIQVVNFQQEQVQLGQQIQIGRKIQKLAGDVYLNAGLRGLNCIVCNKNKLVVFD